MKKNAVIRLFVWYIFIIVENRLKLFFLTSSMRAPYKMQIGERMDWTLAYVIVAIKGLFIEVTLVCFGKGGSLNCGQNKSSETLDTKMFFLQMEIEMPAVTNQSPFAASEAFSPFWGHGVWGMPSPTPPTQNCWQ